MLTAEQKDHFETFGFIVMRQAFSPGEIDVIGRDFDDVLAEDRQGQPFSGEKRQAVMGCIEKRPLLSQLLDDDRIYLPVEQLLGQGFIWNGSDGNLYVGDTSWHPDGSEFDYGRIKVAFYLDPVTKDTGCLRVIPGSHRLPLHTALQPLKEQRETPTAKPFGITGSDVPSFTPLYTTSTRRLSTPKCDRTSAAVCRLTAITRRALRTLARHRLAR